MNKKSNIYVSFCSQKNRVINTNFPFLTQFITSTYLNPHPWYRSFHPSWRPNQFLHGKIIHTDAHFLNLLLTFGLDQGLLHMQYASQKISSVTSLSAGLRSCSCTVKSLGQCTFTNLQELKTLSPLRRRFNHRSILFGWGISFIAENGCWAWIYKRWMRADYLEEEEEEHTRKVGYGGGP